MSLWARRTREATPAPTKVSVERRLSMLVLCEVVTAAVILVAAVIALGRLAEERSYMDRYLFAPLLDIGEAQAAVDGLEGLLVQGPPTEEATAAARPVILRLQAFIEGYQRDWETGTSSLPAAARLRAELERRGAAPLLAQEHEAVGGAVRALHALEATTGTSGPAPAGPPLRAVDVVALREALVELDRVNLRYVQIGYRAFERTQRGLTALLVVVSVGGILAAGLLGLSVRKAIGPRVRQMVEAVQRFREVGTYQPIGDDDGGDDLTILAHTLGLSFRSIEGRDRERERFLGVAAHELKTPLTALKGFAQVALTHPDDPAVQRRALAVIDRQSTRLARLVQDLLWSARAGAGQLPFHPAPVDLRTLSEQVIGEVRLVCDGRDFQLSSCPDPHILGDPNLLEQSLWNLLFEAATRAPGREPVRIDIEGTLTWLRLQVAARSNAALPDDLDELAQPFLTPPFENGALHGTGLGLYLVREIARLHGARFEIERRPGAGIVSRLEFRR